MTASNFYRVCKAVDANNCPLSLSKTILGDYGEMNAPPLVWGKKKENAALQLFMRVCRQSHVKPFLSKKGLRIHHSMNFIGCSVDGLFTCKCHGSTIIEVKCPFSCRDEGPKHVCLKKVVFSMRMEKLLLLKTVNTITKCKGRWVYMV